VASANNAATDPLKQHLKQELPKRGAALPPKAAAATAAAHAAANAPTPSAAAAASAAATAAARARANVPPTAAAANAAAAAAAPVSVPKPVPTLAGTPLRGASTAAAAAAAAAAAQGAPAPVPARQITVSIVTDAPEPVRAQPAAAVAATGTAVTGASATGTTTSTAGASTSTTDLPAAEDEDAQTYFATFDATALSTAWTRLGEMARQQEERINSRERARRAAPAAPAVDGRATIRGLASTAGGEPRTRHGEHRRAAAGVAASGTGTVAAPAAVDPAAPALSDAAKTALAAEARGLLEASNLLRPMTPRTSMELVQRQLPLLIYLPCECHLDASFARALAAVERVVHKRKWKSRFTFAYVPAEAQRVFELTNTYQLDQQLVTVGICPEHNCPGNVKMIPVRFARAFAEPPRELTVSLFQECCGDHFTLEPLDVTAGGFTLRVTRQDPAGDKGWGQVLKARWSTPDLPGSAPGGLPALVLDNVPMGVHAEKHRFYPPRPLWDVEPAAVQATADALVTFLEDFQLGSLPLIVRSQPPAPSTALALRGGGALDVVGDSFASVVLDPTRDVLLFIYAPFCGGSLAVMPLINQVAGDLARLSSLVTVAKIDKTANDFPVTGIKVTHFPTIMLFPAGDYDDPSYRVYDYSDYNGSKVPHNPLQPHSHFTKDMLLKFIWEHAKRSAEWPADMAQSIKASKTDMYTHDHDHAGHH
jgi:hypothetical protein